MDKLDYKIFLSGYIGHALMMNQIMDKKTLFEMCKRIHDELSNDEFNNMIDTLHKSSLITGFTEQYIYQTTSNLKQQLTHSEIMEKIKKDGKTI